jgi:dimethylaniline monooxygenase (N-oxide forming)
MGGVFSIVEALIGYQLGFKGDYMPKDDIVKDFYGYGHVVDTSYKKACQRNEIDTIKDSVKKLTKNTVILESGKEIPCDLLICATGYQKSYDMFDLETKELLQIDKDGLYLYKHCVPVNVPDLFFVGSEVATISNITTYGIQAEWLKSILTGKFILPKKDNMSRDVEDMKRWKRSWMPETSNRASLVLLHQTHYHDSLLKDMNIPHRRKGLNYIMELFAPYQGGDYDGIFNKN